MVVYIYITIVITLLGEGGNWEHRKEKGTRPWRYLEVMDWCCDFLLGTDKQGGWYDKSIGENGKARMVISQLWHGRVACMIYLIEAVLYTQTLSSCKWPAVRYLPITTARN